MMVIDEKFKIGQIVYLKTDPDQYARIVTGINITPLGLTYLVSMGSSVEMIYHAIELSEVKNYTLET